jgi:hypothetical protein
MGKDDGMMIMMRMEPAYKKKRTRDKKRNGEREK